MARAAWGERPLRGRRGAALDRARADRGGDPDGHGKPLRSPETSRAGRNRAGRGRRCGGASSSSNGFLYEEDGSRRSLPRNRALRDAGGEGTGAGPEYLAHLEAQSPSASDVPAEWLPAGAVHVAPQVLGRHEETLRTLAPRAGFVSVDPSPHYSIGRSVEALAHALAPAIAFLPSEREVAHLVGEDGWAGLASRLAAAGFPEVVVKRGAAGSILCERETRPRRVPAQRVEARDPTGAGDAFCGAYAACRLQGVPAAEAARRATVAASLVIECNGADAALALPPNAARRRLES